MITPVRASDQDLRTLAAIVSEDRPDLPAGEGLPQSLLADLGGQIRCDAVVFLGHDSGQQMTWFAQEVPFTGTPEPEDIDRAYWQHYWQSQFCSYPGRTGDLRSIVKITDFYSARQWHSTGMYTDHDRLLGTEHCLMLCLPEAPGRTTGPGRHIRLYLCRGPGPDFSERDRATPSPSSPPARPACCAWSRPGTPTPRSPAASASPRQPCAPTWKTSTNGCRSPAAPPPSPAPSPTGSPRNQGKQAPHRCRPCLSQPQSAAAAGWRITARRQYGPADLARPAACGGSRQL